MRARAVRGGAGWCEAVWSGAGWCGASQGGAVCDLAAPRPRQQCRTAVLRVYSTEQLRRTMVARRSLFVPISHLVAKAQRFTCVVVRQPPFATISAS